MPGAIHHHHAVQVASRTVDADHPAWLNALLLMTQQPIVVTFIPCFIVLVLLMIRYRVKLHRRGERFTPSKTKPAELIGGMLVAAGLFSFRDTYPLIRLVLDWPDRAFPYYHQHALEMWAGFFAAGLAARLVAGLFAALFLRGGTAGTQSRPVVTAGHRPYEMLPIPPPDHGWYRWPETTHRIVRTRTYKVEE